MKIGIIAAMASEREQLARLVAGMRTERHGLFEYTIGQLGGNTLYIMECGIGKVNAAVGASELMARMQDWFTRPFRCRHRFPCMPG